MLPPLFGMGGDSACSVEVCSSVVEASVCCSNRPSIGSSASGGGHLLHNLLVSADSSPLTQMQVGSEGGCLAHAPQRLRSPSALQKPRNGSAHSAQSWRVLNPTPAGQPRQIVWQYVFYYKINYINILNIRNITPQPQAQYFRLGNLWKISSLEG